MRHVVLEEEVHHAARSFGLGELALPLIDVGEHEVAQFVGRLLRAFAHHDPGRFACVWRLA